MGFQLIALLVDDHMATGIFNLCTYAITSLPPSSRFASLILQSDEVCTIQPLSVHVGFHRVSSNNKIDR